MRRLSVRSVPDAVNCVALSSNVALRRMSAPLHGSATFGCELVALCSPGARPSAADGEESPETRTSQTALLRMLASQTAQTHVAQTIDSA
eukprot:5768689-Amphidinium_carterae.1